MEYRIITAAFDSPVYNNPYATGSDKYLPFLSRSGITFGDAEIGEIRIEDDDDRFGYLSRGGSGSFYDDPGGETGQSLLEPANFGHGGTGPVLDIGQRISFQDASVLRDGDGNEFYVSFPTYMDYDTSGYPIEIGDRHSVLIIPKLQQNENGEDVWPTFRPSAVYDYVGSYKIGLGQTSIAYDPTAAPPICFTPGTLILTPSGERPVETLRAGDQVQTRDHGPQLLRWIGRAHLSARQLDLCPNLRPIHIERDALGPGQPARALTVSPQHSILLRSAIAQRMFSADEVLIAAKHLTQLPGVDAISNADGVTYLHLLFDRHELVLSNGTWTESLRLGPQALRGLSAAARREVMALFPDGLWQPSHAVRAQIRGRQGRKLIARHQKNGRPFLPA